MSANKLDPRILGQLLVMQSVLINLPDNKSIFSFVCKGLSDIPGINHVHYSEIRSEGKSPSKLKKAYPITLGSSFFGELTLTIFSFELYKPYERYIQNFVFMIGVILEERNQRELNEKHNLLLEQRIAERTQELKIEKETLAESQRRFQDLMLSVKLLSVMLDVKGNIIFCNPYLISITKYTYDEVIGKNWFDTFLPRQLTEQYREEFRKVLAGEIFVYNNENEIITKDGKVLMVAWNNTLLYDVNKKIIGTASIGENITDRKIAEFELKIKTEEIESQNEEYQQLNEELYQANQQLQITKEKAEESDRLKTAFLQNMSHEIRTPMNAIMGFSDLLMNSFDDKQKLKKFSSIISQRCTDLLEIINDILDIAKIESGQLPVNLEEFDLNELFIELLSFFTEYQKKLGKVHIDFTYKCHCNGEINHIVTDKVKLKQIFINLISNAFKYTEKGKIEFGCKLEGNTHLMFYVSDTGIGIPADMQEKIFERFFQVHESAQKNLGGTGLGLPIVKGLVSILEGEMALESEPEKGSTFLFKLPYNTPFSESTNQKLFVKFNLDGIQNKTILIVEDDFYNMEYLKEILSGKGLTILEANDGEHAVEISLSQPVDLILMDIRLPAINGYEATRQIRKQKPKLKIIAQTAYASNDEKQKALNAGCIDYICKPTKQEPLLSMIVKHLA